MEITKPLFEKYVFVCENQREQGKCCAPAGVTIRQKLKETVANRGLRRRIRVSRAGCLDVCAKGPNVLVMPDNVWFRGVSEGDTDRILDSIVKDDPSAA